MNEMLDEHADDPEVTSFREIVREAIDDLYQQGRVVKALDADGQPLLRNGQQVFRAAPYATAAESSFWRLERRSRHLRPSSVKGFH